MIITPSISHQLSVVGSTGKPILHHLYHPIHRAFSLSVSAHLSDQLSNQLESLKGAVLSQCFDQAEEPYFKCSGIESGIPRNAPASLSGVFGCGYCLFNYNRRASQFYQPRPRTDPDQWCGCGHLGGNGNGSAPSLGVGKWVVEERGLLSVLTGYGVLVGAASLTFIFLLMHTCTGFRVAVTFPESALRRRLSNWFWTQDFLIKMVGRILVPLLPEVADRISGSPVRSAIFFI